MAPILTKKKIIGAAEEAVEGVAETSVSLKYLVEEPMAKIEPVLVPRHGLSRTFARQKQRVTRKLARITFKTQIVGSGTADEEPAWGIFLRACGFAPTVNTGVSVQYDPVTNPASYGAEYGNVALTMWVYEDGTIFKARGCRGTVNFTGEAGGVCMAEWEFFGVFVSKVDGAYPSSLDAGYDTGTPPLVESAAFNFQGTGAGTALVKTFNVNIGNTLTPRYDVSSSTGVKHIFISDREVKGKIDPEMPHEADTGWGGYGVENRFVNETVGGFEMTLGASAGNIVSFTAPAATVQIDDVGEEDRDGLLVTGIDLGFRVPFNEGSDPEFRITTS